MTKEQIAKLAHEANRAYCDLLGDHSVLPWEQMTDEHKASFIAGVEAIIANPTLSPEEGHQKWVARKKAEGWKYGENKDPIKKEHPCLVPYSSLPITLRFKDYLFHSVVVAALE